VPGAVRCRGTQLLSCTLAHKQWLKLAVGLFLLIIPQVLYRTRSMPCALPGCEQDSGAGLARPPCTLLTGQQALGLLQSAYMYLRARLFDN